MRRDQPDDRRIAVQALLGFAALLLAWSAAWIVKRSLDPRFAWLAGSTGSAVFWFAAKVLIWIVPAWWFIRQSGGDLSAALNLAGWRRWLLWGGIVGLLIAATAVVPKLQRGALLLPEHFDHATFNVLVVSPVFEEFLIRGALLGGLVPAFGFARANAISAACFVLLHVPGWFMMGSLAEKLEHPIGGALSIFVLGLCFGWATRKGGSFLGGSVAHFLNNLVA